MLQATVITRYSEFDATTIATLNEVLFRFARCRVATDDQARDLVQQTWLATMESMDRYAGRCSMRTWMTSILRRKIADRYRRRRPTVPLDESYADDSSDVLEHVAIRRRAERVLAAVHRLPPRERQAVELCGLEELDRNDAADRMGLSRPTLRVTLCRGRRHLRELAS